MNHTPLKFLRGWSDYMFGFDREYGGGDTGINGEKYSVMPYYDSYTSNIIIDKIEPDSRDNARRFANSSRDTHRTISRTTLVKAYPYLINDVTVNNGPNQPIRFQATFYYEYSILDTLTLGTGSSTDKPETNYDPVPSPTNPGRGPIPLEVIPFRP